MNDPFKISVASFSINNNSKYTNSRDVTLTLIGDGIDTMCISNSEECSYYEPFKTTKDWTLTNGNEEKTVYVYYKDSEGNLISSLSKNIILDTVAPTNNSVKLAEGTSQNRTLTLSSEGADTMCFSNTSSDPGQCSNWENIIQHMIGCYLMVKVKK